MPQPKATPSTIALGANHASTDPPPRLPRDRTRTGLPCSPRWPPQPTRAGSKRVLAHHRSGRLRLRREHPRTRRERRVQFSATLLVRRRRTPRTHRRRRLPEPTNHVPTMCDGPSALELTPAIRHEPPHQRPCPVRGSARPTACCTDDEPCVPVRGGGADGAPLVPHPRTGQELTHRHRAAHRRRPDTAFSTETGSDEATPSVAHGFGDADGQASVGQQASSVLHAIAGASPSTV